MIERHEHGPVLELRLARPPVNALSPDLVALLRPMVADAAGQGYRALVLSGSPKVFSGGLDVVALMQLDANGMRAFWRDFHGLMAALARSAIPVAAAITGHSPAGGAVLSLFCDYRVMAQSADPAKPFRIGLNEVQVGLTVPDLIQRAMIRLVGAHRAERMMVAGAMVDTEEARRIGLIDAAEPVDAVIPHALDWCRGLLALPPVAMSNTRRFARRDLAEMAGEEIDSESFLASWFSEETQRVLSELVARLTKKA